MNTKSLPCKYSILAAEEIPPPYCPHGHCVITTPKQWLGTLSPPECEGQVGRSVPACLAKVNSGHCTCFRSLTVPRSWPELPLLHLLQHSALGASVLPPASCSPKNTDRWQAPDSRARTEFRRPLLVPPKGPKEPTISAGMWHSLCRKEENSLHTFFFLSIKVLKRYQHIHASLPPLQQRPP